MMLAHGMPDPRTTSWITPVADDAHLLRCYRYIELNPVRAGMLIFAGDYAWSSYRSNALGHADPLIRSHACDRRRGTTDGERQAAYRDLVQQAQNEVAARFSDHLRHQHPMGNERFRAAIKAQLGCGLTPRKGRRPKKQKPEI